MSPSAQTAPAAGVLDLDDVAGLGELEEPGGPFSVDMLMQPCETFVLPCCATDHGAACTNSPLSDMPDGVLDRRAVAVGAVDRDAVGAGVHDPVAVELGDDVRRRCGSGCPGLPALIGKVCTSCVAVVDLHHVGRRRRRRRRASPRWRRTPCGSSRPRRPRRSRRRRGWRPASPRCSPASTWTGRKCTSASLNQFHAPSVGLELVTRRWLSTAALSATGSSKYTRIGMPTPTTMPSSGPIDGVESVSGLTVVKVDGRRRPPCRPRSSPWR